MTTLRYARNYYILTHPNLYFPIVMSTVSDQKAIFHRCTANRRKFDSGEVKYLDVQTALKILGKMRFQLFTAIALDKNITQKLLTLDRKL